MRTPRSVIIIIAHLKYAQWYTSLNKFMRFPYYSTTISMSLITQTVVITFDNYCWTQYILPTSSSTWLLLYNRSVTNTHRRHSEISIKFNLNLNSSSKRAHHDCVNNNLNELRWIRRSLNASDSRILRILAKSNNRCLLRIHIPEWAIDLARRTEFPRGWATQRRQ